MDDKGNDKQILLLNRSFWPDIEGSGQTFTSLCEQLAKVYKVVIIAGRSYYHQSESFGFRNFYKRELFNGVRILRVCHAKFWKASLIARLINWFTYGLLTFLACLRMNPRLIIAGTDPPFLGIIAMVIKRLKAIPFIYYCVDLYPDCALEIGKLKPGFFSHTFDYLNKKALDEACLVVALGQSMEDRLIQAKGMAKQQVKIIPLSVDTTIIKPVAKPENPLLEKFGLKNKFIIMYSGNIGLSQDFSSILKSIALVEERSSFYLVFIGEGAGKEKLKAEVKLMGLENVLFFPYQPKDMLLYSLGLADLHLVPLKRGMAGASVPGKVYAIMAAGKPYLAITDKESEPTRLVQDYGCGLWAAPGDIEAISRTIRWALNHPRELEGMGEEGRQICQMRFDENIVIQEWFAVLDSLGI